MLLPQTKTPLLEFPNFSASPSSALTAAAASLYCGVVPPEERDFRTCKMNENKNWSRDKWMTKNGQLVNSFQLSISSFLFRGITVLKRCNITVSSVRLVIWRKKSNYLNEKKNRRNGQWFRSQDSFKKRWDKTDTSACVPTPSISRRAILTCVSLSL